MNSKLKAAIIIIAFVILGFISVFIAYKCGMSVYVIDELGVGIALVGVVIATPLLVSHKKK